MKRVMLAGMLLAILFFSAACDGAREVPTSAPPARDQEASVSLNILPQTLENETQNSTLDTEEQLG